MSDYFPPDKGLAYIALEPTTLGLAQTELLRTSHRTLDDFVNQIVRDHVTVKRKQQEHFKRPISYVPPFTQEKFDAFLKQNPQVWDLFVRFTFEAISDGHDHLSSRVIVDRIRWEAPIHTAGTDVVKGRKLKISNGVTPYLSRKFHEEFPSYDGFFTKRQTKKETEIA